MAINFPNNPSVNDTFTVGGINFTFTGVKWESGAVVEISSDTTPSLGGTLDAGTHNINNVGVITATTFSGNLTGNVTGTATTATNAQGLTGDPSIQVTNATVLGNLDVQGTTTTIDTAVTEVDSLNVEGSVGIGTTNPQEKLDLRGNAVIGIDQVSGNPGTTVGVTTIRGHHANSDSDYAELYLSNSKSVGGGTPPTASIRAGREGNNYGTNLSFYTNGTGSAGDGSERVRITSSGVVGINTDVSGNGSGAKFVVGGRIQSNAGGYWIASASGAEDGWHVQDSSGNLTINESGVAERLRINSSGNVVATGTISDSKGELRKIIKVDKTAQYTLVASDAGKAIYITTGGVIIPNNVLSAGDAVTIINRSGSDQTITSNLSNNFYHSGVSASPVSSVTLAGRGMATIWFAAGDTAYISGAGLT